MHNKKLWALLASVSLVIILTLIPIITGCAGPTPTPTPEVKTLKLGGCLPLTGPASVAGLAFKQGWDMAVDKINEEGGLKIGGSTYMIDLIIEDDKSNPEGATTAATKLCYEDKVKFVLGSLDPILFAPAYKITCENEALMIITMLPASEALPGCYAGVGPDKPLLIKIGVSHDENLVPLIKYFVENYPNVKTVCMMALDFPEYQPLRDYYATEWAPLGLEVNPNYELFPADCMDFTPYVSRSLAANPDAIYVPASAPTHLILIIKTSRELGFNGPILYGPPFDPSAIVQAVPNLSDVITPAFALDAPNLPDSVKEVVAAGRARYGNDLVEDAIFAYDQVILFAQLLEKTQSLDPQTVLNTFETLTKPGDLQSIFGPAYVGGLKTTGVNRVLVRPTPLSRVMNGKGEFLGMFPKEVP
jgi:branched-chain amino acid transport system substrate-binding protein